MYMASEGGYFKMLNWYVLYVFFFIAPVQIRFNQILYTTPNEVGREILNA